jgi:hypothetical protein
VSVQRQSADLCACVHLADDVVDADVRDAAQERLRLGGVPEEPRLALLVSLAAAALDHVAHDCPRRAGEADERNLAVDGVPRARERLEHVPELLLDIDVLAEARKVRGRVERRGEARGGVHADLEAHRLRDDKDVAEDDRGVEEALVPPERLERDLACELGRPADLEELVLCAHLPELCAR